MMTLELHSQSSITGLVNKFKLFRYFISVQLDLFLLALYYHQIKYNFRSELF